MLPANTALFVSIPNLSATLAQANSIFEERVKESPVLQEWWNADGAKAVRRMVEEARTISDYLGDEVVLAVPMVGGKLQDPMMVAEARKRGLTEYLQSAAGGKVPVVERDGFVTMNAHSTSAGFEATEFGKRIAQSYANGAGWLFAADMEQILPQRVVDPKNVIGMGNVRYVILERKPNLGRTENSATVSFNGTRNGIASWIAAPGPMGTLDFISADATFAASFVVNQPGVLLTQLSDLAGGATAFAEIQKVTGVDVTQDIASTLGGEMTVAVDGPLLPTPSWKVAVEVNNPSRLEWSIEQMVKSAPADAQVKLTNEVVGGLTYYTLSSAKSPIAVEYVFTDGYLLLAPNHNLLSTSIQNRTLGMTLTRSTTFRALLPQNGQMNFSALVYYNAGAAIAPMADQLKSTNFLTADQKKALAALTADRAPTLIYAYAEADRIVAATRGSFFGLGLDTLIGLNGKGAGNLLPTLMAPALGLTGKL